MSQLKWGFKAYVWLFLVNFGEIFHTVHNFCGAYLEIIILASMSASLPSSSSGRDGSHAGRSRAAGHAKRKESDLKMIVEESLVDSTWLSALKENFLTENEAFPNVDGINFEPNGTENPDTRRFRYQLFVTPLAGLIQWTRVQNSVRRQDALYSDVLNTLNSVSVIAANSAELCRRALLSSDDVTFIEVDEYLQKMIQNFEKHCKRPSDDSNISRVILLFTDLEKQITKAQKKVKELLQCSLLPNN